MSDDAPTEPAIAVVPIRKQASRLIRLLRYIASEKEDWQNAVGPALTTIDELQENLENIREAIILLSARGKEP